MLAEGKIKAVGSTRYTDVDVRVIAATWRDLPREINRGNFRSDLFFRIEDERIDLPALRQRIDDIPLLVEKMMRDEGKGDAFSRVTPASIDTLSRHTWPGNVRELYSLVRRALSYDDGGPLDLGSYLVGDGGHAPRRTSTGGVDASRPYEESKDAHDHAYFKALFEKTSGNVSEMSRQAVVTRTTVRAYVRRYGLGRGEED